LEWLQPMTAVIAVIVPAVMVMAMPIVIVSAHARMNVYQTSGTGEITNRITVPGDLLSRFLNMCVRHSCTFLFQIK
jgi:hypothetical protein